MQCTLNASRPWQGKIEIPGDKSISHRAIMLASIAPGISRIHGLLKSSDTLATVNAMRSLGVTIEEVSPTELTVHGVGLQGLQIPKQAIDCGNSGTTMRLMAGLCAGANIPVTLIGDASLMQRPMQRIAEPLRLMGAAIEINPHGKPPIKIFKASACLTGIHYQLPIASAQVKSALLLAGLFAAGKTILNEPLASRDHTEKMLSSFHYPIYCHQQTIEIEGKKVLNATDIFVPGDISAAAFFIVAATIVVNSDLLLTNIGINPTRIGMIKLLQRMGANIEICNLRHLHLEAIADLRIRYAPLQGITVLPEEIPSTIDEIPILCIAAANAKGTTIIRGASELRYKESDRIQAMAHALQTLGIAVQPLPDGLSITGSAYHGGKIECYYDHRIAMSLAIAALTASSPVTINGHECIDTSFPDFMTILGTYSHPE